MLDLKLLKLSLVIDCHSQAFATSFRSGSQRLTISLANARMEERCNEPISFPSSSRTSAYARKKGREEYAFSNKAAIKRKVTKTSQMKYEKLAHEKLQQIQWDLSIGTKNLGRKPEESLFNLSSNLAAMKNIGCSVPVDATLSRKRTTNLAGANDEMGNAIGRTFSSYLSSDKGRSQCSWSSLH